MANPNLYNELDGLRQEVIRRREMEDKREQEIKEHTLAQDILAIKYLFADKQEKAGVYNIKNISNEQLAEELEKLGYRKESEVAKENEELKTEIKRLYKIKRYLEDDLTKQGFNSCIREDEVKKQFAKEILTRLADRIVSGIPITLEFIFYLVKEYGVEL